MLGLLLKPSLLEVVAVALAPFGARPSAILISIVVYLCPIDIVLSLYDVNSDCVYKWKIFASVIL